MISNQCIAIPPLHRWSASGLDRDSTATIGPPSTRRSCPALGIGDAQSDSYAEHFNGLIDEVRISNAALLPGEFLVVPEPTTLTLVILGAGIMLPKEIARPYMPPVPAVISNNTLADAYNWSNGNADCPYDFIVSGDLTTNLVVGDNVLAVEVHNYSSISPDITFGVSLSTTNEVRPVLLLDLGATNGKITLSWTGVGFFLQQANSLNGSWTNVPGSISNSPYSTMASNAAQYFRLRK